MWEIMVCLQIHMHGRAWVNAAQTVLVQFLSSSFVPCSIMWTKGNGNRAEIASASFYSQTAILLHFTLVGNTVSNTWEWSPWHQHWEAKNWGLPESQLIIRAGSWLCLCFPHYTITMQSGFSQSLVFGDTSHQEPVKSSSAVHSWTPHSLVLTQS